MSILVMAPSPDHASVGGILRFFLNAGIVWTGIQRQSGRLELKLGHSCGPARCHDKSRRGRQPLSDDLIYVRGKAKTKMSGSNLDVFDVERILVDASLPGNDRVSARIDRNNRRTEGNAITKLDFGGNRVNVDTPITVPVGDHCVFGAADDGGTKRNDLADEIRPLACQLARQVAAEAPTDKTDLLIASSREGGHPFQYPWQ